MKTSTLLLSAVLIASTLQVEATVRRVNNVPSLATTCATCYTGATAFQGAIDASIDGDTIHLEPSGQNYGNASIAKRLVIIGAGYKLGAAPLNTGLQANAQTSMVNFMELVANSDGTQIIGLSFPGSNNSGLFLSSTSNILIARNFINLNVFFPGSGTGVHDITLAENYMVGVDNQGNSVNNIANLTIRNNIVTGLLYLSGPSDVMTNVVVTNNTFTYNGVNQLINAEVAYNVFYLGDIAGTNNTIHDNITAAAITGADLASNPVVSMGNVYNLNVGTDDSKYEILASSPYNEGGPNERGAFSGISPYRLSGIPTIPTIYTLQSTLNTTPGGTVNVTLSTKSNN